MGVLESKHVGELEKAEEDFDSEQLLVQQKLAGTNKTYLMFVDVKDGLYLATMKLTRFVINCEIQKTTKNITVYGQ